MVQSLDYLKETPSQTAGPYVHIGLTPNKLGNDGIYPVDLGESPIQPGAKGEDATRVVLKLHPQLAPIKVAVMPLVKKGGMPEKAREVVEQFFRRGISARYDEQHAIGKRYRRHDEIGTPWCLTIDGQTLEDGTLTIRDRDTMQQRRISVADAVSEIEGLLRD